MGGGRTAFVGIVCTALTNPDISAPTRMADLLSSCQYAFDRDIPLSDLCASVTAQQILRELVPSTQLLEGDFPTVKSLVDILLKALAKEQSEAILRMLGSLMFWAQIPKLGMDEEVISACNAFIDVNESPKKCRLAVECVANLLMRSNAALNSAKDILYRFFQAYLELNPSDHHLKVSFTGRCILQL